MSIKVKAYTFSIFLHFLFILFFSYFVSWTLPLSQKYLEIDLSTYDLIEKGSGNFEEENSEKKEIKKVKTTSFKTSSFKKGVTPEKVYYPENTYNTKTTVSKIEETAINKEEVGKGEMEGGLIKNTETRSSAEEGSGGGEKGGKGESISKGTGVGKGSSSGTGLKPEELYLHSKLGIISKIVQNHISYPYLARKMGWEGKVIISFLLTKEGKVVNFVIEKTSSYEILDQNAIETVKKCAKLFPLPPVDVKIRLPIVYQLN